MKMKWAKSAQVLLFLLSLPILSFAQNSANTVPNLNKIIWVWLENTSDVQMFNQRYSYYLWTNFPSARFTHYLPPSKVTQPNVMTLIGGTDFGVMTNNLTRISAPTLIDLLELKNIPWKVYAEDFPGACYLSEGVGNYKRYRVPFLSFAHIQSDRYQCMKIVGFANFADDVTSHTLPQFSVVIPNLKNSGALGSTVSADNTLIRLLDPILMEPDALLNTTVVISTINQTFSNHPEVMTLILGNGVKTVAQEITTPYSHLNLLRTFEDGLHLGTLPQGDASADPMTGFWK